MSPNSPTVAESSQEIGTLISKTNLDSLYGDNISNTNKNNNDNLLLIFENINGLGHTTDSAKGESIRAFINQYKAAAYLMAEMNVNWRVVQKKHSFAEMTRNWFETQRTVHSYNRYDKSSSQSLPGGTGIISIGDLALKRSQQGEDKRKLGRWSWQRFQGKDGQNLRLVSVYVPTLSSTYGNKKVFFQQQKALLSLGVKTGVYAAFWNDFWKEVDEWLAQGDEIIIGGDWNCKVTSPAFLAPFQLRGLSPGITGTHGPPYAATHSRGSNPIEEFFTTAGVEIVNSGYMEFGSGVGDHRPLFLEITTTSVFGTKLVQSPTFEARRLKCHDPAIVQRYLLHLTNFFEKHQLVDRLFILYESHDSILSAEHTEEYEILDALRERGMLYAESKCRKLHMGGKDWSPLLQQARHTIEYTKLCLSRSRGAHVGARTLIRLSKKTSLIFEHKTVDELIKLLHESYISYSAVKAQHRELRLTFLEQLAERQAEAGNISRATSLHNLIEKEANRALFRKLKFMRSKGTSLSTTSVTITNDDGTTKELHRQEDMEEAIREENRRKYHQSEGTCPFLQQSNRLLFGDIADGPAAIQVLNGTFNPPPSMDEHTVDFLHACAIKHNYFSSLTRSVTEFRDSWKIRKESTSSRLLHFGHFKASLKDDLTSLAHYMFAEIPFRTGYAPNRWKHATQLMILKKAGLTNVEKLRTIVLFEADFNHNNQHLARKLMHHAVDNNLLAKEQYSTPGKKCIDQVLNRQLIFDITRYQKTPLAITSCDLTSCYDRIVHTPAILAMASLGVPLQPMQSMFKTIQESKFYTRTALGDSDTYFGGIEEGYTAPPQGSGQGNTCGPCSWTSLSSKMFEVLHNCNLASEFRTPISQNPIYMCGFAFVDDSDLLAKEKTKRETLAKMQRVIDKWSGVATSTGGAIETSPAKTWWYMVDFQWHNDKWSYTPPNQSDVLTISSGQQATIPLTQMSSAVASQMLGIFLSPDFNQDEQFKLMKSNAINNANSFGKHWVNHFEAWTALTRICFSSLQYPLPVTCFSEKACKSIVWPLLRILLPKCGINKYFPRAVLYGPVSVGGLGIWNIYWLQGVLHIVDIINHQYCNSVTGELIQNSFQQLRLEIGSNSDFFNRSINEFAESITTNSWSRWTWAFMSEFNITFRNLIPIIPPRRDKDQCIMDTISLQSTISKKSRRMVNRCRKYLQVFHLSDITSGDGRSLTRQCMNGERVLSTRNPTVDWQQQGRPPSYCWTEWRKALRKTFCTNPNYKPNTVYKLKSPLGRWLEMDSSHWKWFLDRQSYNLFSHRNNSWFLHKRLQHFDYHAIDSIPIASNAIPFNVSLMRTTVHLSNGALHSQGFSFYHQQPTPVPKQPVSSSWLFFQVVQSTSISTLLRDLQMGMAIMVTDGSYKDQDGTAAWIIESQNGEEFVMGLSITPGSPEIQNAYRSEVTGILAILQYLENIMITYNYESIGGIVACDSSSALLKGTDKFFNVQCNHKHADLLSSCTKILNSNNIHVSPKHVLGHQDDSMNYQSLPRLSQMNVRMDYFAKQSRTLFSDQIQAHRVYIPLGSSFSIPYINQAPIYDQVKSKLYHAISIQSLQVYWERKLSIDSAIYSQIHWKAFASARKSSSLNRKIFVSKWISEFIATGKNMQRWKLRYASNCPYCLHPQEDTYHILTCTHPTATEHWNHHLKQWTLHLSKYKLNVSFIIAVKRDLEAWRTDSTLPSINFLTKLEQQVIFQQRTIGWFRFLQGFLDTSWEALFQEAFTYQRLRRKPNKWIARVISANWTFSFELWNHRNKQLHDTQRIQDLSGRKILLQSINNEIQLGLSCLPANEFSPYFSHRLVKTITTQNLQIMKDWFISIRSARHLYKDINTIHDDFSTDTVLQSWVGFEPGCNFEMAPD